MGDGCAMIEQSGIHDFLVNHPPAGPVLLLIAISGFGWLEAAVFKQKTWALWTWLSGLLGLTLWIARPLTVIHICTGLIVFVSGATLMSIYFRRK